MCTGTDRNQEQPLKQILHVSSNENVVHEQGISEERYEARKWRVTHWLASGYTRLLKDLGPLLLCLLVGTQAAERDQLSLGKKATLRPTVAEEIHDFSENRPPPTRLGKSTLPPTATPHPGCPCFLPPIKGSLHMCPEQCLSN